MQERGYRTDSLHGSLWSHGLELAEAEIGRGPAPSERWSRRPVSAGAGAGAAEFAEFADPEKETWAAQAA